jgi:hypothetical protein
VVLGSVPMLVNIAGFVAWLLLQRRLTRRYTVVYSSRTVMLMIDMLLGEEGSGVHRRLQPSVPVGRPQPSTLEGQ